MLNKYLTIMLTAFVLLGMLSCLSTRTNADKVGYSQLLKKQEMNNREVISKIDNIDSVMCSLFSDSAMIQFDSISFSYMSEVKRNSIVQCLEGLNGKLVIINNPINDPHGYVLDIEDSKLNISHMRGSDAGWGFLFELEKQGDKYLIKKRIDGVIY
jgi:hypothetical protein